MKLFLAALVAWIVAIAGITQGHWTGTFVFVAGALSLVILFKTGMLRFVLSLAAPVAVLILFVGALGGEYSPPAETPTWQAEQRLENTLTVGYFAIVAAVALAFGFIVREIKKLFPPPTDAELVAAAGLPTKFRILKIGSNYVEFEHPEGGSWSYGSTQDLSNVRGITNVVALGNWRYRAYVSRNPKNAAKVLQDAFTYRNSPKPLTDGAVNSWEIPGYDTLFEEAERNLD